jgi:hypothetical protein
MTENIADTDRIWTGTGTDIAMGAIQSLLVSEDNIIYEIINRKDKD